MGKWKRKMRKVGGGSEEQKIRSHRYNSWYTEIRTRAVPKYLEKRWGKVGGWESLIWGWDPKWDKEVTDRKRLKGDAEGVLGRREVKTNAVLILAPEPDRFLHSTPSARMLSWLHIRLLRWHHDTYVCAKLQYITAYGRGTEGGGGLMVGVEGDQKLQDEEGEENRAENKGTLGWRKRGGLDQGKGKKEKEGEAGFRWEERVKEGGWTNGYPWSEL